MSQKIRISVFSVAALLLAVFMLQTVYAQPAGSTGGAPTGSGALSIQDLSVTPNYVVSGDNISLSFQLYNSYSSSLRNVNLDLEASNPLLNVSPSYTSLADSIGSGTYGGLGLDVYSYNIHVPSTLPEGVYTISVVATYETTVSDGLLSYDVPGESVMPIYIYVHGLPKLGINLAPSSQIEPNQNVQMQIAATNFGTGTAYNVTAVLENSTYFKPFGNKVFVLGNMEPGAPGTATADMYVAKNIVNGTQFVNMLVSYQYENGTRTERNVSVPVGVLLNSPDIIATVQSTEPPELYIGSNQSVQIAIQNVGSGLARNVSVSILSGKGTIVGSSSRNFFISSLQQGQSATESILVSSNQSSPQNSSDIYAMIGYEGANYMGNYSKTVAIPLSLFPSAEFNVTAVRSSLTPGGTYLPVTYEIKNIGNEPAKEVSLSLQSIYPITPVSGTAYVENIMPGSSANVTFYVDVDPNGAQGSYPVTLYEQWRQPNGASSQQFSGSSSYYINVGGAGANSGSSAGQQGNGQSAIGIVIAVVVVLAIAAFVMRRRSLASKAGTKGDSDGQQDEKRSEGRKRAARQGN